ncbi:MAG: hypothetical protein ACK559_00380, partial [bacterium]
VVLRIAVVQADREDVLRVAADVHDLGRDALDRREVDLGAGLDVHRVRPPVLVAAAVLQVHDVRPVRHPEVLPDAAVGVLGHRLRRREVAGRGDPDVQHPVDRGDPRDHRARRAE